MVKFKKNNEEVLPLSIVSNKKVVSKKSITKKFKNNDDFSKKLTVVKEKQSRNRMKEQVVVICTPEGPVENEIKTNCKVWSFLDLNGTKVVLTKGQIDSIREIGFGRMLDIKITKYAPGILAYLVSNFDPNGWVQRITNGRTEREYYISAADVNDTFGLPINPRNLIRTSFNNKNLVMRWRKFLGAGDDDELKTHMILDRFKDYPDGGKVFKQLFALYVGSTILAPLPEHKIRYNLLPVVEEVISIPTFDWCHYTLSILASSIARILKLGSAHSTVNGCVLVLLVAYCYLLIFKGQRFPKSLPLIKNISDQMLKVRFYEERETGFGNGMIQVDGFPVCEVLTEFVAEDKFYSAAEEGDCEVVCEDLHADVGEACMNIDGNDFLKFKIPNGVKKDADIKSIAEDGRNVVIEQSFGASKVTKDGVTVAKSIEFKGRFKNLGASLVKQVANCTNDVARDGTRCATVLTRGILIEGVRSVGVMNARDFRRGMTMAVDVVVTNQKSRARIISTYEEIAQVGTISANGDRDIGELIAKAMEKVGKEGLITIQDGKTLFNESKTQKMKTSNI